MCKPTEASDVSTPAKAKTSTPAKVTFFLAAALPFALFVVLPAIISEAQGGWTRKYTHNAVGFSVDSIPDLSGRVAIVTGANTGIGFETAKQLTLAGAQVVLTARTQAKGDEAVSRIVDAVATQFPDATEVRVKSMVCNLSSLQSVKKFVADFKSLRIPLHILVLNAGVMKSPGAQFIGKNMTYGFGKTVDGFEEHIGINHIAHHYIATRLLKELKRGSRDENGGHSRVVSVSSSSHGGSYQPEGIRFETWKPDGDDNAAPEWYEDGVSYGQSKLANILFAREFAKRYERSGVMAYSVHPGVIQTDLARYISKESEADLEGTGFWNKLVATTFGTVWSSALMKAQDGALTQLYAATAPEEELVNGGFYWPVGAHTEPAHPQGTNETLQEHVWAETEAAIEQALAQETTGEN